MNLMVEKFKIIERFQSMSDEKLDYNIEGKFG